jgi:hypothetical protein
LLQASLVQALPSAHCMALVQQLGTATCEHAWLT